ncbi:hypothetical protein Ae201684P_001106 [Aphanomyces euteiches]|uniref:Uncharacterized protein n=1 Tax=Aphanomyces euteiches TaxID=100861 RepID=A0A6G0WPW9_9STRA|nr:hypothetical protein Ae201684_012904 [Aphanomyces euteiches]KAH9097630.1 hypothetical protein Ae201684P_001106 [Aphanomyces euteiches]
MTLTTKEHRFMYFHYINLRIGVLFLTIAGIFTQDNCVGVPNGFATKGERFPHVAMTASSHSSGHSYGPGSHVGQQFLEPLNADDIKLPRGSSREDRAALWSIFLRHQAYVDGEEKQVEKLPSHRNWTVPKERWSNGQPDRETKLLHSSLSLKSSLSILCHESVVMEEV